MVFIVEAEEVVFKVGVRLRGSSPDIYEARRRLQDLIQSEYPDAQVGVLYRLPVGHVEED